MDYHGFVWAEHVSLGGTDWHLVPRHFSLGLSCFSPNLNYKVCFSMCFASSIPGPPSFLRNSIIPPRVFSELAINLGATAANWGPQTMARWRISRPSIWAKRGTRELGSLGSRYWNPGQFLPWFDPNNHDAQCFWDVPCLGTMASTINGAGEGPKKWQRLRSANLWTFQKLEK